MSVIVLKTKFQEVPKPADIMQILLGNITVDEDKAAKAMEAFMGPMTNLLKLFNLIDGMSATAERHSALLTEQEELSKTVAKARAEAAAAKASADKDIKTYKDGLAQAIATGEAQKASLSAEVSTLEKRKTSLSQEIESDQATKLKLDSTVAAEYDRLRKEMLAKVAQDEKDAKKKLDAINANILLAQNQLAEMEEKRQSFLKAFGGVI